MVYANRKVLVIDDESAIVRFFQNTLHGLEYEVVGAGSGEEGIAEFRKGGVELLFLDIKMREMNGLDVLKAIRQIDFNVPIYVISGFYENYFDQLKTLRDEGYEFELVRKPLSIDVIRTIVKGLS